jgi:hypothetical protein
MKTLYKESKESLKRLPRQILKASTVLGVTIAISTMLNLNEQLFKGAIALGVIGGIAVVAHDEIKSTKNEQN